MHALVVGVAAVGGLLSLYFVTEHAHAFSQLSDPFPFVHADSLKLPQRLLLWAEFLIRESFALGLALDLLDIVGASGQSEHGDVGGRQGNGIDGLVFGVEFGSLVLFADQIARTGSIFRRFAGATQIEHSTLVVLFITARIV